MTHCTRRSRPSLAVALLAALLAAGAGAAAGASAKGTTKHRHASKPIGAYTTRGTWSFASAPKLHPPKLYAIGRPATKSLAGGDFLLANFPNLVLTEPAKGKAELMVGQSGPLILDDHLQPVWFAPVPTSEVAGDLQQETYQGQPVLTWWQGVETRAGTTTSGEVVVVNQHYQRIATVKAPSPWVISLHDAVIRGTGIWVTAYRPLPHQNLTRYGGSRNGTVYDAAVQQYALPSGKLISTWDALSHVPLSDSEQHPPSGTTPWDAYHLNAIQVLGSPDVVPTEILVSMRNTWGIYLINTVTGHIVWTLGGKHSSFKSASDARFAWQHDARQLANGEISVFNDNCCELQPSGRFAAPTGRSAGMVLKLNQSKRTVSLVRAYRQKPAIQSYFLGSMQVLPGGRALVGWGSPSSLFTEFTSSGKQLLEAGFPPRSAKYAPDLSYRVLYTAGWVGTPSYPPSGATRTAHGKTAVYASWNGATAVAGWEVLAGASAKSVKPVARARRAGFETRIVIGKAFKVYEVRALGPTGAVLGTSPAFK